MFYLADSIDLEEEKEMIKKIKNINLKKTYFAKSDEESEDILDQLKRNVVYLLYSDDFKSVSI